jgi:hypothetical protein
MCFDIEGQCHIAGTKSQIGSSVQSMRFSAKIPLHLKAQARYKPFNKNTKLNNKIYQIETKK